MPASWSLSIPAFSRRAFEMLGSLVIWATPRAACSSVIRKLKPGRSYSYGARCPWFRKIRRVSAMPSSSVVTTPPSPVVTFFVA